MSIQNPERHSLLRPIVMAAAVIAAVVSLVAARQPMLAQGQIMTPPKGTIENVSFEQIANGVIRITFDLRSDPPGGRFSIALSASDDGGRTFGIKPTSVTGDTMNVPAGARKSITWRSGDDVAVLVFDQLKFDVQATAGVFEPPSPPPPPLAGVTPAAGVEPPSGGGNLLKFLLPAAGGAGAAVFLLTKKDESTPPGGTGGTGNTGGNNTGGDPAPTCTFAVDRTSWAAPQAGGSQDVNVTVTPSNCSNPAWPVTNTVSFITPSTTGSSGNGKVTLTASANTATTSRSGSLTIAGKTVDVTQAGATPPTCTFTISPPTWSPTAAAGTQAVTVTASPAGCTPASWTASTATSFLSLSASSGSGTGSVTVSATANPGPGSRTGSATIAGQTLSVTQAAPSCTITLSPFNPDGTFPAPTWNIGGGASQNDPTASPTDPKGHRFMALNSSGSCAWTSSIAAGGTWLHLNPTSGTVNGTALLDLTVDQNNTGASRVTTVTIQFGTTQTQFSVCQRRFGVEGACP